ncbi:MAG: hypothetical protein JRJ58_09860 [Deltaproteobacteria bacterium]|nr:hypothetical protein [Deltaproteobacteria bacterium]
MTHAAYPIAKAHSLRNRVEADADADLADEMIAKPPGSVFAGQFAPRGTIEREADAFRR